MFSAETQLRVRYGETDQMGVVYHGNYPLYFEVARIDALRSVGMTYKELESDGIFMPVLEVNMKYLSPARYDDLLTIKTYIKELPSVRIAFYYEIFNEQGEKLTDGFTRLVFVSKTSGRPVRCPESLLSRLKPFFQQA